MLANATAWIVFFGLILAFGFFFLAKWIFQDAGIFDTEDVEKEQPKSKKFNVPKINLPKFKDSGWVSFYVVFGCISFVLMIVFFVQDNSTFAFMMLGCPLCRSTIVKANQRRLQKAA